MTRGNQRELARLKNLKKQGDSKGAPEGKLTDRRERDADAMRKKQEAANKKKEEAAAAAAKSSKK